MSRGQPRDTGFPAALSGDLPGSRGPEGRALCPPSWPPVTLSGHHGTAGCVLCPQAPCRPSGRPGVTCAAQSFWVKLKFLSEDIWETTPKDLACVLLSQSMCVFVWLLNHQQCLHAGDQILVRRHSQLMGLSEGPLGDVRGRQMSGTQRLSEAGTRQLHSSRADRPQEFCPFHLGPAAMSGTSVSRPSSVPRARGWWPPRTLWPVDLP